MTAVVDRPREPRPSRQLERLLAHCRDMAHRCKDLPEAHSEHRLWLALAGEIEGYLRPVSLASVVPLFGDEVGDEPGADP